MRVYFVTVYGELAGFVFDSDHATILMDLFIMENPSAEVSVGSFVVDESKLESVLSKVNANECEKGKGGN